MDCSTPGFPVLQHFPELAQTHVHWVGDAIQPSRPLSSPSPPFPPLYSIVIRLCCCWVTKSCLTLCDPMDCSLPGSSVHGIFQARILEWVAISFSRGSSWPRDQTRVSCISCTGTWMLYCWAAREAQGHYLLFIFQSLSRVQLFATLWTAARQASLSFTISWSFLRLLNINSFFKKVAG